MSKKSSVQKILQNSGVPVEIIMDEKNFVCKAIVSKLDCGKLRNNHENSVMAGRLSPKQCRYMGPAEHRLDLAGEAKVLFEGEMWRVIQSEAIRIGKEVIYVEAILQKECTGVI